MLDDRMPSYIAEDGDWVNSDVDVDALLITPYVADGASAPLLDHQEMGNFELQEPFEFNLNDESQGLLGFNFNEPRSSSSDDETLVETPAGDFQLRGDHMWYIERIKNQLDTAESSNRALEAKMEQRFDKLEAMANAAERDREREASDRRHVGQNVERIDRRVRSLANELFTLKRGFRDFSRDVKKRLDAAQQWHEVWDKIISKQGGGDK